MEDHGLPPVVHYLADFVNKANTKEVRLSTTEAYKHFAEYLKENGYKFDCAQNRFITEMTSIYQDKKVKSCEYMYFDSDIPALRKLLVVKYKFNFNKDDVEDDESDNNFSLEGKIKFDCNIPDDKPCYKKLYEDARKQIDELKRQIEKNSLAVQMSKNIVKTILDGDSEDEVTVHRPPAIPKMKVKG